MEESPKQTAAPDKRSKTIVDNAVVSSAHPLASEAGKKMLRNGGNAIDAAVATTFALNVVEPNMSGIGGGGSATIWLDEPGEVHYTDFYPAKRAETYRDLDRDEIDEDFNLLSTGIPGTVDGMLEALDRFGNLSREEVMQPAIDIAENGFPVYLTLAEFIEQDSTKLNRYEETAEVYWPGGEPLMPGEILKQPDLAEILTDIKREGRSAFYEGENAEALVEVLNEAGNPAGLDDVASYESQWDKNALCSTYRGYTVLSAPPPQTGMQVMYSLNLLDQYNLSEKGLPTESAESFNIITAALRAGLADRAEYVRDPKWTHVPATGMISEEYAKERSSLIVSENIPDSIEAGNASDFNTPEVPESCEGYDLYTGEEDWVVSEDDKYSDLGYAYQQDEEYGGETTHLSVVDQDGNAVSLSTTLSPVFGSGASVNGYLLNTSGYNFEHMEDEDHDWQGNHEYRVRASTISPTIILDEDENVKMVIGTPGAIRIPIAIIQNISYMLDYGMNPMEAVRMPRIFPSHMSPEVEVERGFDQTVLQDSREMGYDLTTLSPGYARLYMISRYGDRWMGVSDPRHEGQPAGF